MAAQAPALTNLYLHDDAHLVALSRDADGRLQRRTLSAEWVAYYAASELPADILRMLRGTSYVRSLRQEGDWWRVGFVDRIARKLLVEDGGSPLRQAGVPSYEGDVHPVSRWAADEGVAIAQPRRAYLDIETDSRVTFAEAVEGAARVLCVSIVDAVTGARQKWTLDAESDVAEAELIGRMWEALDPYDQIAAWNGDGFDYPVLGARSKMLRLRVDARRWLLLDHLAAFKRMNNHSAGSGEEKRSMALDAIGHAVTGKGKLEVPDWARAVVGRRTMGAATWDLWAAGGRHRDLMTDYCGEDTDLLRAIEKERPYLQLFQTICEACGIFGETRSLNPTVQMDGFMLRLGATRGHHFATREYKEAAGQFKGAWVMQPRTHGLARGVHVCDFKSLYPSVILTFNMSPETKRPAPPNGPIPDGCARTPTGVTYDVTREGVLVTALRELLRLRDHYKKLKASLPPGTEEWKRADNMSTAYKVVANSFYGVLSSFYSRFCDVEIGESITQTAKWLCKQTMAAAEERGWRGVYSDSVTGDRVVVARDPEGNVQLLPIERLWERGGAEALEKGKPRRRLDGWLALARDEAGDDGWFPIQRIVRHRSGKTTWRVSTKHGQTQVTTDHGIMVGGVETRPADFVDRRDSFTTVDAPREAPCDLVDLYAYVRDATYESEVRREVTRFHPEGEWLVFGESKYGPVASEPVRVKRFYERGSAEWDALLRLVAAYVSDGSASINGVTAGRSMLSFCKADLSLQERIAADLRTIAPGLKVYGPFWTETVYVVRSGTRGMAVLFDALCGHGSKGKRLPDFAYRLDADGFAVLLEGLERGDGSVDAAGQFIFTTTSQELAAGVSYVLSQHGCPHGWTFRESKGAWSLRTRKGKERPSRYSVKAETFAPAPGEWVYDLTVEGAHTFVDGIGRVLLHNTDSCYVVGPTEDEFRAFTAWCNAELYPRLIVAQGCRENHIKVSYEKEFALIAFAGAKKYVGRFEHYEGKRATDQSEPEIKGMEYVRGDALRLASDMQAEVIDMLVGRLNRAKDGGPVPTTDLTRYRAVLARYRQLVLEGDLTLDDLVLSKALNKPLRDYAAKTKTDGTAAGQPPHVQVAKVLKERGREVREGTRIEYVVADGAASPMRVIPAEDYTGTEADRFYLWESLVYPPTQRLLEAAFPPANERGVPNVEHDWAQWAKARPRQGRGRAKVLEGQLGFDLKPRQPMNDGPLFAPLHLRPFEPPAIRDTRVSLPACAACGHPADDHSPRSGDGEWKNVCAWVSMGDGEEVVCSCEDYVSPHGQLWAVTLQTPSDREALLDLAVCLLAHRGPMRLKLRVNDPWWGEPAGDWDYEVDFEAIADDPDAQRLTRALGVRMSVAA